MTEVKYEKCDFCGYSVRDKPCPWSSNPMLQETFCKRPIRRLKRVLRVRALCNIFKREKDIKNSN